MFNAEYVFYGHQAEIVKRLTEQRSNNNFKFFQRNIDVFLAAPTIGLLYGKKDEQDKSRENNTKIFTDQMIRESLSIDYLVTMILLVDNSGMKQIDDRIRDAFNFKTQDMSFVSIFENYLFGGLSVLESKLLQDDEEPENLLFDFIEEFNNRYYTVINSDELISICRI